MSDQHRVSSEQHTADMSDGGWTRLAATGYWYLNCACGEWEANNVPTGRVETLRRQHEACDAPDLTPPR